jgi:ketosteroid isomerase-like protein
VILGAMSQENVEMVRASLDAWNRGDVDAWLEAAHPEIEWVSQIAQSLEGSETVYRGPTEMRRYWEEWHALWEVTIEVTETIDRGDTVIALANVRTRGEASGIDLERPIAYVFEFEDGLARRARAYFNQQEALDAVSGRGSGAA